MCKISVKPQIPRYYFVIICCVCLADQLLHVDILDMASAYKFEVQRYRLANEKETDVNDEEVTVCIMADLQEQQDKESEGILAQLQEKVNT